MTIYENSYVAEIQDDFDRRVADNYRWASSSVLWLMVDFVLLNSSFFISNFVKRGTLDLPTGYANLLFLYYICWAVTFVIGKKSSSASFATYGQGVFVLFKSSLYMTYCVTFLVVVIGLSGYSRGHIFSTCILLFVSESLVWSGYNKLFNRRTTDRPSFQNIFASVRLNKEVSYFLVVSDFLILIFCFFLNNYLKRGSLNLLPEYGKLLVILIGLWFISSLATSKFAEKANKNSYFFIWQWMKAGLLMLAMASVLVFGFRLFHYSRFQVFGTIVLMMLMELIFLRFHFRPKSNENDDSDIESADKVRAMLQQEDFPLAVDIATVRQKLMEPARNKIQKRLHTYRPELFTFIDEHVALDDMLNMETSVERCCQLFDVNADRPLARFFLNLCKMNDIRWLNKHFLQIHQMLMPGGYYVAYAHTIRTHYEWVYSKFPRYIAHGVYAVDFLFRRVMPKLPGLQKIYFGITKGKNRVISRAEFLGRLCFCGFEIVAEKEIDKRLYVIAKKAKTASLDTSPTYGPIVELKRSGYNSEVVYTYKFRTMHPYSEYLQKYVFDMQGLQEGGKIEDDFRLTTWGKVMRKLWIDELPMLYNWLRGDFQLVGVRPLSFHYLSLYDAELQELRKKVRPGLVPPFYADLPVTFEEICDSERRYIKSFLEKPIRTQWVYFWKSFNNIVLKGSRSK